MTPLVLTPSQVAAALQVSKRTVLDRIHAGDIPTVDWPGERHLVPRRWLEDLIDSACASSPSVAEHGKPRDLAGGENGPTVLPGGDAA